MYHSLAELCCSFLQTCSFISPVFHSFFHIFLFLTISLSTLLIPFSSCPCSCCKWCYAPFIGQANSTHVLCRRYAGRQVWVKPSQKPHLPSCIDFHRSQPRGDGSWVNCHAPVEAKAAAFTQLSQRARRDGK